MPFPLPRGGGAEKSWCTAQDDLSSFAQAIPPQLSFPIVSVHVAPLLWKRELFWDGGCCSGGDIGRLRIIEQIQWATALVIDVRRTTDFGRAPRESSDNIVYDSPHANCIVQRGKWELGACVVFRAT